MLRLSCQMLLLSNRYPLLSLCHLLPLQVELVIVLVVAISVGTPGITIRLISRDKRSNRWNFDTITLGLRINTLLLYHYLYLYLYRCCYRNHRHFTLHCNGRLRQPLRYVTHIRTHRGRTRTYSRIQDRSTSFN